MAAGSKRVSCSPSDPTTSGASWRAAPIRSRQSCSRIFDTIGTLAIGVLLIVVAILVGVEVKAMLVGQGIEESLKTEMIAALEKQPDVKKVLNLVSLQMGNDVMIAVKVEMKPLGTDVALLAAINRAEVAFRAAYPQVAFLFFEPDVHN